MLYAFSVTGKGHLSTQCLSTTAADWPRRMNEVITDETNERYLVTVDITEKDVWEITLNVPGKPVIFKCRYWS